MPVGGVIFWTRFQARKCNSSSTGELRGGALSKARKKKKKKYVLLFLHK